MVKPDSFSNNKMSLQTHRVDSGKCHQGGGGKGAPEFKNGFMKEVAFEQRIGDGADFQHVEVREKAKGWGKES